jgi:very-short-patch-repair endonuclease
MKIVDSLLNRSEETVLRELEKIASDNAMRIFVKPRLSDVIQKDSTHLTNREFDFYTRSHCDFVVADADARRVMIVEYDGPLHQSRAKQQERDEIKNELCRCAGLGLLRINDNYVTKLYRGMTVLRWIVEVAELEKAFYAAQRWSNSMGRTIRSGVSRTGRVRRPLSLLARSCREPILSQILQNT